MKFKEQAINIVSTLPQKLKEGTRVLFLVQRQKDGGGNSEEKRIFSVAVIEDEEDLIQKLSHFLAIRDAYTEIDLRVYLSVNSRNKYTAIRNMLDSIIESFYCPDVQKELITTKLLRGAKSSLMNPNARKTKYFLIDVDSMVDVDTYQEAMSDLFDRGVTIIHERKTRNGWHIITEPFNPAGWNQYSEIKKDALMLLI